jgi:branched-subunit amino acid ABC-type transport system permease component
MQDLGIFGDPAFLVVQCLNGLTQAMFLFLIASGLTLIFGVLGVLNFAHGSLYMLGAYFSYTITSLFVGSPWTFWVSLLLGSLGVALAGGLVEALFLRPVYRRQELEQLLVTYALVLIISDTVKFIWGPDNQSVSRPAILAGSVDIGGRAFPTYNLFVLLLGPLVALGLWLLLSRTQFGRLVRAAANDREMVGVVGVDVSRLFTGVFMLGAWLGGIGGGLAAPVGAIYPGMDVEIIAESFIVVVVGGMGSLTGTLLGALIIGQLNAFGILFFPRFALVFVYVLMVVVLVTRPWGQHGKPQARAAQ